MITVMLSIGTLDSQFGLAHVAIGMVECSIMAGIRVIIVCTTMVGIMSAIVMSVVSILSMVMGDVIANE
jgi:hypothetical protein